MKPFEASGSAVSIPSRSASITAGHRLTMIAEAAYFRAEARGFEPGAELDDWLDAEAEVDQRLAEHGLTLADPVA